MELFLLFQIEETIIVGRICDEPCLRHSVIAETGLQRAFAAATANFRPSSARKSIHI